MDLTTTPRSDVGMMLDLVEIKPGVQFSKGVLRQLLPDVETALFFAKLYALDAYQLTNLLAVVVNTTLASALFGEAGLHSSSLQSYLIGGYDEDTGDFYPGVVEPAMQGQVNFSPDVAKGEILPHVWEEMQVEVADSIKTVAAKLGSVVTKLPGKNGEMVFSSLRVLNKRRPTIGDYRAQIKHAPAHKNLLILDVSGSMSSGTIATIVDDVVALSYKADAALAIVSNTTRYWEPGMFDSSDVLREAEYGGTHYETLADLLDSDWGTVITVADYDSSQSAKEHIRDNCHGSIELLLDVSLVNRPTFLAECVGQLANEVRPLLIASHSLC